MAAIFSTQIPSFQFIPYQGPPETKQPTHRNPLKVQLGQGEQWNKGDSISKSDRVKGINITGSASQGDCKTSNNTDRENSSFDQEAKGGESSNQPVPLKGSCQKNAVIIEDSHSDSDIDESSSYKDGTATQIDDQPKVSNISILGYVKEKYPAGAKDSINSAVGRAATQVGGFRGRKPASTQQNKAERDVKFTVIKNTSSSGMESNADDDDHSSNHKMPKFYKQKRSLLGNQDIQTLNSILKQQRPKGVTGPIKQRKRSLISSRPSRPSATRSVSALQDGGYNVNTSSSDDNSDDSSDNSSKDHARHRKRNKQSISARHSRKNKQKRSHSSADKDKEYEVEEILDARANDGELQYRAKWLGYDDDRMWYNASNFENSPLRVRDFHKANTTHPGPL